MKQRSHSFWLASGIYLCCLVTSNPIQAQVSADGTLSTKVTTTDSLNFTITNGNQAGKNLFHSFSEFSVPTRGSAFFNNASDIQNIISRVTGSSVSNIDGLIRANGTANLILLNPNVIIFGRNASLNINGSFIASTASSLKFANDNQFSTNDSQATPVLTVSVPIGLQFGENPGSILVQGDGQGIRTTSKLIDTTAGLRVQPNRTLALVGGNVVLEGGTLKTAGGRIELGSVASPSLVSLTLIDNGWALGYEGIQNFQDIQLSQRAVVDTSGAGGGDVQVRGRQVKLTNSSRIEASTLGSEPGGTLAVTALELLDMSEESVNEDFPSGIFTLVYPEATGAGSTLTIETGRLSIRGYGVQIAASTFGAGNAGNLTIKTGQLSVRDGVQIAASTFGAGNAGALIVRATDSVELSGEGSGLFTQANRGATGAGGNLTLETARLSVQDGAQIAASTFGSENAGNLIVRATELVELSGKGQFPSGLFAQQANLGATGTGGNLTIETRRLNVRDGATVRVRSLGTGNAGNLQINASSIRLENDGKLTATSASGEGGNIRLSDLDLLLLRDNSEISTDATAGTGNGGNITIDTDLLAAVENSNITANAVEGRGGNIRITAQGIFLSPNSRITARSERGIDGIVEINRPDVDPTAELVVLPAEIVDVSGLVAQGCPIGRGNIAGGSQFVVTGRGGLPPTPTEATRSDSVLADLGSPVQSQENHASAAIRSNSTNSEESATVVEAQGWVIGSKGEVMLTASAPTVNPDIPWLTPTSCNGS